MFTGALASLMRFWGGSQNLVFPLADDLGEHELFWALADRLDADHYLVYNGSIAELELLAPEQYAAGRAREAERLVEFDQQIVERHLEDWRGLWIVEGEVPEGLEELLVRRLAPLHGDAVHNLLPFGGLHEPPYPFADVGRLAELPRPVTDPRTSLGDVERLLVATEVGILPPGLRERLTDREVAVVEEPLDTPASWRQFIFRRVRRPSTIYPLRLTEFGLNWYRRRPLRRNALPVVVGDDAWDFALFYALRRFGSLAYWVPTGFLESEEYCRNVVANLELQPAGATAIAVISASDADLRERTRARLAGCQQRMGGAAPRLEVRVGDWRDFLTDEPNRLFERDNYGLPQPLLVARGRTSQLPTPLPRHAAAEIATDLRWMTDVAVQDWSAARNHRLGPRVLTAGGYDENYLRCGSDGAAYHCPHFMTIGGASLESSTVRPVLRPLDLLEQITAVLEAQGWQVRPSDKGIYTRETTTLFGGVSDLAAALRTADTRLILNTYLRDGNDGNAPGRWLTDDRRRYLSLADISGLLDENRAAALLGQLEPRNVLLRGVILKCLRCRAAAFYSAADFEPSFRCLRCRLEQAPDRYSWFGTVEPIWYYRLDEVIFQFLTHNGHLPLLTAHDRFGGSTEPTSYAFELDLIDDAGARSELDLAVLEGARLWIGEATINDRFEASAAYEQARLTRLAEVAGALDAYGVILSTSSATFASRTKARARAAFGRVWPRLELREGVAIDAGP